MGIDVAQRGLGSQRPPTFTVARATALAVIVVLATAVWLIAADGPQAWAQSSVNGLVSGSYYALGAVGLTLVYGILRLVNFAHGDMLTLGAYVAVGLTTGLGTPYPVGVAGGVLATAAVGLFLEQRLFRPMRTRRAGTLQLILITIGLAFLIRNAIQFAVGSSPRAVAVDVTSTIEIAGIRIGTTEAIVVVVGLAAIAAVAALLRWTTLGKQMRALADDLQLAEATGIDTDRIITCTWLLAGGLAGLAGGLLAAAAGAITPVTGSFILLNLFAAVILGGIGDPRGALLGGLALGVVQEWSTLELGSRWKLAVGFALLILVLVARPQGILGKARTI
ncbi:MAG: branched-chain amino acid transport system permease protein [Solirubrobacteraceae bacterium]